MTHILSLRRRGPARGVALAALSLTAACAGSHPVLYPDAELERQTVVRPSRIPGAGRGAFARIRIRQGDVIGEYGGRLLPADAPPRDTAYLIELPACAVVEGRRYGWLDGRGSPAHMARVNFAPRIINGVTTGLQNARIAGVCHRPFIVFVALRDIAPGEEILTSYGPHYGYEAFMGDKTIQRHFCARLKLDCSRRFEYRP